MPCTLQGLIQEEGGNLQPSTGPSRDLNQIGIFISKLQSPELSQMFVQDGRLWSHMDRLQAWLLECVSWFQTKKNYSLAWKMLKPMGLALELTCLPWATLLVHRGVPWRSRSPPLPLTIQFPTTLMHYPGDAPRLPEPLWLPLPLLLPAPQPPHPPPWLFGLDGQRALSTTSRGNEVALWNVPELLPQLWGLHQPPRYAGYLSAHR